MVLVGSRIGAWGVEDDKLPVVGPRVGIAEGDLQLDEVGHPLFAIVLPIRVEHLERCVDLRRHSRLGLGGACDDQVIERFTCQVLVLHETRGVETQQETPVPAGELDHGAVAIF